MALSPVASVLLQLLPHGVLDPHHKDPSSSRQEFFINSVFNPTLNHKNRINEATCLEDVEHLDCIQGTCNNLIDTFISDQHKN